jgi:hypothetical protein
MGKARFLVVDGTFDRSPEDFGKCGQMYNIRAYLGSEGVSVGHAFLPKKFKSTYLELFGQLKRLCLRVCGFVNWTQKLFLVDFEQGAIFCTSADFHWGNSQRLSVPLSSKSLQKLGRWFEASF